VGVDFCFCDFRVCIGLQGVHGPFYELTLVMASIILRGAMNTWNGMEWNGMDHRGRLIDRAMGLKGLAQVSSFCCSSSSAVGWLQFCCLAASEDSEQLYAMPNLWSTTRRDDFLFNSSILQLTLPHTYMLLCLLTAAAHQLHCSTNNFQHLEHPVIV